MRMWHFLVLLVCANAVAAEQPLKIPVVSACELYSHPERFDGELVEVVGRINVQFENMALVCRDEKAEKAPLLFGIWLRLDLNSIRERSPLFFQEIEEGYRAACRWKGALIGEMRFRGHFALSKDWEPPIEGGGSRQRIGFGHLGMFGAEIVVEEVLGYRSALEKPNQPVEPTRASVAPAADAPIAPVGARAAP